MPETSVNSGTDCVEVTPDVQSISVVMVPHGIILIVVWREVYFSVSDG
jgi:hypothetical protein